MSHQVRRTGVHAALASALLLGLAPVFGKQAILLGFPPLAVVAWRTILAALLLLLVMLVTRRKALYIYPAGLMLCLLAGALNGAGSLLYYSALGRIDAGLGQLLYALYPLFVTLWLWLGRQPPTRLTLTRLMLTIPAVVLLAGTGHVRPDPLGVMMMLAAAALYALHLPVNQRVLYDMPAPTVTLYTLLAMSAVVVPAYVISLWFTPPAAMGALPQAAWLGVAALTLVTFFSRLALFTGVKQLGGQQTALLGLGELLVTLLVAHFTLGERFTMNQWAGAVLLVAGLGLHIFEKSHGSSVQGEVLKQVRSDP